MAVTNILRDVATYNRSNLAFLLNSFAFISTSNKKFKNFNDDIPKNLGATVSFDLPPRFTTTNSLVASFQGSEQRVHNLTVDKEISTSYEFTAQEFILNVRDYMERFGKAAVAEIGSKIEADVAELAETNTYRFFGDGVTPISSYLQLANALAFFRNYGAAKENTCGYLSDLTYPSIVNSGLAQFAPMRNNREAMSWEVGEFSNAKWYQSNLLKTHVSGVVGNTGVTLVVDSVDINPATGGVRQITFSGAPINTPDAVFEFDKFQFLDIPTKPDMRFLTFVGHQVSQSPVQFRSTGTAGSNATGQVTVSIFPELQSVPGKNQNINHAVEAGMEVSVLPSHRCGLIMSGNPLFLAMPRLPEEVPFPTSVEVDPDSGASLRQYYGSRFAQNQRGFVHDCIWGRTLVDEYAMMVALPV